MAPPLIKYVAYALPDHCEPTSSFLASLSSHLHICLPTLQALLSSTLGTLSILSWLFAQLPQIYKNYQLQSTSSLSIFFLIIWCLGDMGNLLGALFTKQAAWQVIIAGYYVFVDITLVFQFFWYTHIKGRRIDNHTAIPHPGNDNAPPNVIEGISFSEDGSLATGNSPQIAPKSDIKGAIDFKTGSFNTLNNVSPSFSNEKLSSSRRSIVRSGGGSMTFQNTAARTVLLASMLCTVAANAAPTEVDPASPSSGLTLMFLGTIFSWMSTVLYLGSRPPQLYKNYHRKSTSGLSPLLFMAAFCGNLFYSSSLLTNPNAWYDFAPYGGGGWADADGNNRFEWVARATPFFLGAFGVLFLDGFMGVQFLMYGSADDESVIEIEDTKRGRWTRVRGWMRGWIPSPVRKPRSESGSEEQSLFTERRSRYGTV
jgi:uncharacterized protein with PQ loop repeat